MTSVRAVTVNSSEWVSTRWRTLQSLTSYFKRSKLPLLLWFQCSEVFFRGSWSQLVACNAGTAWCGTAVGLIVTPTAFNLPMDPTFFFDRENILWCGANPVSCARPKPTRAQACTSGCAGSADISRACPTNLKLNKSLASLFFTR